MTFFCFSVFFVFFYLSLSNLCFCLILRKFCLIFGHKSDSILQSLPLPWTWLQWSCKVGSQSSIPPPGRLPQPRTAVSTAAGCLPQPGGGWSCLSHSRPAFFEPGPPVAARSPEGPQPVPRSRELGWTLPQNACCRHGHIHHPNHRGNSCCYRNPAHKTKRGKNTKFILICLECFSCVVCFSHKVALCTMAQCRIVLMWDTQNLNWHLTRMHSWG